MKLLICVFAAAAGLRSFGLEISSLPLSAFPDTEIATTFPFAVAAPSHRLAFSLEFQSTVSNSLEVAIGRDANEDGELSLDEASLAVGYDCGEWFVRSAANDSVVRDVIARRLGSQGVRGAQSQHRSGVESRQGDAAGAWRVERKRHCGDASDGLWNHTAVIYSNN